MNNKAIISFGNLSGRYFLNALLLFGFLMLSSFKSYSSFSQNSGIIIEHSDQLSVVEVFDLISDQTQHTFIYRSDLFADAPKIKLDKGSVSIEELLSKALEGTAISHRFSVDGRILLEKTPETQTAIVQKSISGTVRDEGGQPVMGATVVVKGTTRGTTTDFDGKFSIDVAEGDTIEISYLSYETYTLVVGTENAYTIVMKESTSELDEVVITGYTNYKRNETPSAITTLSSGEIQQVSAGSFNQVLQGKVPGMQVTSSSGQPGETPNIIIRGVGSIDGTRNPLYIMDGVPIEGNYFETINANDIASVTVLKDASAKAQYGSRGSNGVVIITTKKGQKGKLSVNYSSQYGISERGKQRFEMMNTAEALRFQEEVGLEIGRDIGPGWTYSPKNPAYTRATPQEQRYADYILDSLRKIDIDWRDIFLRTGQYMDQNLSISGGTEKMNFYNSFNYHEQQGIVRKTGLRRFNLRSNVGYTENKFSANLNLSVGFSNSKYTFNEGATKVGSPLASMYYAQPYEYPYYNGVLAPTNLDEITFLDSREGSRGIDAINNVRNQTNQLKTIMGLDLNYQILPSLSAMTRVGIDYRNSINQEFVNPDSYIGRDKSYNKGGQGTFGEGLSRNFNLVSTSGVTYKNVFNEVHDVEVSGFFEYNYNHYRSFNYTGYGIDDRLPETPAGITVNSTFLPDIGGRRTFSVLASIIGTGKYVYNDKYTLTTSYRYDGSSKVSKRNRWHGFYSVGANWNLKNEDFLKDVDAVRTFGLRTSYGQTASEFGGDFLYLPTYSVSTNYGNQAGIRPTDPGNPDFDWEYVDEFNIGLDLALFSGNRIRLTTDFYNRITRNMFLNLPLSATSGFISTVPLSSGKMRNQGVEVNLEGGVIKSSDWSWDLGVNFGYNKNEILHVTDLTDEIPDGDTRIIKKGLPYGTFIAPLWAGVNPDNGESQYYTKDGQITTDYDYDKLAVPLENASYFPKLTGGFNTTLAWKNFRLTSLFTFATQVKRWNNQDFYVETNTYMTSNQSIRMLYNRWKQPGDQAILQRIDIPRHYTSKDIQDASFLRLRNVKLSYSAEDWLLRKIKFVNNITVFVEGSNLYTWTSFRGLDPENAKPNGIFSYPSPSTFTFGINVDF